MEAALSVSWPVVIFDADYFPYVVKVAPSHGLAIEPDLVLELVAAFDAMGRPVTIDLDRDWTRIEVTLSRSTPDMEGFDEAAKAALARHHNELPLISAEDLEGMDAGVPPSLIALSRRASRPVG